VKPAAGEHSSQEPKGRPGVTDVQDIVRLPEDASPNLQGAPPLLDRDAQGA
jgi:hypothetical protein